MSEPPLTPEEIREYRQLMQAVRAGRLSARFILWFAGSALAAAGSLSLIWGTWHGTGR